MYAIGSFIENTLISIQPILIQDRNAAFAYCEHLASQAGHSQQLRYYPIYLNPERQSV